MSKKETKLDPQRWVKKQIDPRHEARRIALQSLFEWSFHSTDIEEIVNRNLDEYLGTQFQEAPTQINYPKIDKGLALYIVNGVTNNLDSIDKVIEEAAPEWPVEQIAKIDLEALRIAIFELHVTRNVPPKVAIDEAIELGKEYGGENSGKFVNGVLGTVVRNLRPEMQEKK